VAKKIIKKIKKYPRGGATWRFPALVSLHGVSQRIFSLQGDLKKKNYRGILKPTYFAGVSTI
jgi:hypothetical protein